MMKLRVSRVFLLFLTLSTPSFAVIAAKLPVNKIYTNSATVLIAKISAINEANRVLEVNAVETLTGNPIEKLRVQLIKPEKIFPQIKVGDPILFFFSRARPNDAVVHLAGTWLLASGKPDVSPPIWQITGEHSADFYKTFPGTTDTLIRLMQEIKAGKSTFLNAADERLFTEGAHEIAQLKITPTNLFTADLDGDKTAELLISTPHGPRIFAKSGDSYQDITKNWSLPESGMLRAVGDANEDKKPDLLIDKTMYLNQGNTFKTVPAIKLPEPGDTLAINIIGGRHVLAISKSGRIYVRTGDSQLTNPKETPLAAAIFEDGTKGAYFVVTESSIVSYDFMVGAELDFTRLTGEPLSTYLKNSAGKFRNSKLVPIDANGDGRRDLLVISEGSNFLLINRGFGAFFVSPAAAALALGEGPDKPYPFAASATSSHWSAIDSRGDHHEDLLILTPDATLYRLGNPPQAK